MLIKNCIFITSTSCSAHWSDSDIISWFKSKMTCIIPKRSLNCSCSYSVLLSIFLLVHSNCSYFTVNRWQLIIFLNDLVWVCCWRFICLSSWSRGRSIWCSQNSKSRINFVFSRAICWEESNWLFAIAMIW